MSSLKNTKPKQDKKEASNVVKEAAPSKETVIQEIAKTTKMVTKKDGTVQEFSTDKLRARMDQLLDGLAEEFMGLDACLQKVSAYAHSGITTAELDNLLAETAAYLNMLHPDCGKLAARVAVTALHKRTKSTFSDTIEVLYRYVGVNGEDASLIADDVYEIVQKNKDRLNAAIVDARDLDYDYFGYKTLEKSYLLKVEGATVERPQHMILRVALGIHKEDIDSAIETYDLISQKWFTHATPTLFNAGTRNPQMSSCFLLTMQEDSIDGIYNTLHQTALISKAAGGIGLSVHNIRATGTYIKGTNGISNGLLPMLKVFNETARYVDQGGGKRKGSFAIYLEPWHADIVEFLQLKKNHGKEENRARDLFYALWVPDLFMKRLMEDGDWTLFCPNKAPGLPECHGAEFEELYTRYEAEGRGNTTMKAQKLWDAIIESQIETGTPYMLFKDHANSKSNQQNLGTIKSSNLCCEIVEYTSKDEVAVCNLASICLPKFVTEDGKYDHEKLHQVTRVITKNLNRIIDRNYYPIPQAKNSNMRHRPIGIGIQGLADALIKLKVAFEDPEAERINSEIFETIYHAAMEESVALAKAEGPYETFKGSPLSQGKFQFDLWNEKPATDRYDWDALRKDVIEHGARNSLLVAPMPTASTAQIMGNNESFEPYTTNIYTRRVLSGEFVCVNAHLVKDLIELGLWNAETRNKLVAEQGSVQNIKGLPQKYKNIYKTIWEISQKQLIKLARCRAPYICQSQSLNIYFAEPSLSKLSASHIFAWKSGLKTGQYYLRSRPARDAIQFTLDLDNLDVKEEGNLYNTKNLSKAEMQEQRRLAKKRSHAKMAAQSNPTGVAASSQADLTKKRKVSEMAPATVTEKAKEVKESAKAAEATAAQGEVQKPWEKPEKENAEEEEEDSQAYRWDVCSACQ